MYKVKYLMHNIFGACDEKTEIHDNADLIRLLQDKMITVLNVEQIEDL